MAKKKHNLREYILYRVAVGLLGLLPQRIFARFTAFLLVIVGYGLGIRKQMVLGHLRTAFPQKSSSELKALARKVYYNIGLVAGYTYHPRKTVPGNITFSGLPALQKAQAKGRGVILATMHMGNWELGAAALVKLAGLPVSAVMQRMRNPYMNSETKKSRQEMGLELIYEPFALKQILLALQKGHLVALLSDLNAGRSGILLNWLGKPASVHDGAAKLAVSRKLPLFLGYCIWQKDHWHIELHDLTPADEQNDYLSVTLQIKELMEQAIYQYPEQWFWLNNRYKKPGKARITPISPSLEQE